MRVVKDRKGRQPGKIGTTIRIYDQTKNSKSYSLTVHGTTPLEAYNKIKFFFKLLETKSEVFKLWMQKKPLT